MKNGKVWVVGLVVAAVLAINFATVAAMTVSGSASPFTGDTFPWLPVVAAVAALAVLVGLGLAKKK